MNKPQDMMDEKLDFAIADLMGWVNAWDGKRLVWVDGATNEFRRKVTEWHPSSDPAASLEVQAKAIDIKFYKREGLTYDLTYRLFNDVEDIENCHDAYPEDFKVRVDTILADRVGESVV
ncbi:hypothetical protein ACE41H_15220 [Paenibacillus enshidis]|uniref:Phage portal protein n=1 Tax=Paenibacillus enshidis TaxID=1458439 RepID=A0ABV5AV74_9BACL